MTPLVSVIIPTYNRGALIAETLDSILKQTYLNWECIVVDDGSTDNTYNVVKTFCDKDNRFQYHNRPVNRPKGGNTCRNYGLELCKGIYINWFDSDDLMSASFIEKKVELLEIEKLDFVVAHSVNFDEKGIETPIFTVKNQGKDITAENYIRNVINWITMDAMLTRQSIGYLRFNEKLRSGQEYNFYSRYLLNKPKGKFIYKCLAKRRFHSSSIQQQLKKDLIKEKKELLFNEIVLLKGIKKCVSKPIIHRSLKRIVRFNYETQKKFTVSKIQFEILIELVLFGNLKVSSFYLLWLFTNFIFGKGYFWIKLTNSFINAR